MPLSDQALKVTDLEFLQILNIKASCASFLNSCCLKNVKMDVINIWPDVTYWSKVTLLLNIFSKFCDTVLFTNKAL